MKEVKVWDNRPRWMWCWDDNESTREKQYVTCILSEKELKESTAGLPVCAVEFNFKHCAEIEEESKRACTTDELLEMLKKQGWPMLLCKENNTIYTIAHINKDTVDFVSRLDGLISYDYSKLCSCYTLIDGTELWINEVRNGWKCRQTT